MAISGEMLWTTDAFWIAEDIRDCDLDAASPENVAESIAVLERPIKRLRLEAPIREAGGWWRDGDPRWRDQQARATTSSARDAFTLSGEGVSALRELCADRPPAAVASARDLVGRGLEIDRPDNERRLAALLSAAERRGIVIPQEATA